MKRIIKIVSGILVMTIAMPWVCKKARNAQKHSWPLWRIEPTQRRHILILSHVESGVRSPEEKTLCQEICSGVYFFLLRIRICEWAIGLTCKEKNEKSWNEMCRKNIIVCSFDVSYAVIVIFSQQPLKQEVKHHCKKITFMAWPIEYSYCKRTV